MELVNSTIENVNETGESAKVICRPHIAFFWGRSLCTTALACTAYPFDRSRRQFNGDWFIKAF